MPGYDAGRFNAPPNWPVPAGWQPPAGWEPDPDWPPAPPGWQLWVDDAPTRVAPSPVADTPATPIAWSVSDAEPGDFTEGVTPYTGSDYARSVFPADDYAPPRGNPLIPALIGGAVVAALGAIGALTVTFIHQHREIAAFESTRTTGSAAPAPLVAVPTVVPSPHPQPPPRSQSSGPVLDGAYRVDLDFAERQIDGVVSPAANRTAWWAYRSICKPGGCVATATMLDADLRQNTDGPASTDVFRFVGDHWEDPPTPYPGRVDCPGGGTAAVTMLGHSAWYPQADGGFQGVQVAAVQTPVCGVQGEAFRVPFTATRIGDVPPGVAVADPAAIGG